jgi:formylglycine-generating enzyme required for sulfatase activity
MLHSFAMTAVAIVARAKFARGALRTLGVVGLSGIFGLAFAGADSSPASKTRDSSGRRTEARLDLGHGVAMDFVLIPAGSFVMGSPEEAGDGDESPPHKVTLTEPFYLGKYEVTQQQWETVMGANPSRFKGAKLPVESVSWNDCQRFLAALQLSHTGRQFSLPTEAQWEYACRAGTMTRWSFGNDEALLNDYAWWQGNSGGVTHPVGEKKPNAWGLYDMHGNVGEWTADWYAKHAYDRGDVTDPHQAAMSGHSPVWRGGAWGDNPNFLRSAARNVNGVDQGHHGLGFRCVMRAIAASAASPRSLSS